MRIFVAAWVGSTNLGDEMIFASVLRRLRRRGAEVSTVSVDPAATRASHGESLEVVSHRSPLGLLRQIHRADAIVFGGGGLLQDETSQLNLPYHLSRLFLARLLRRPIYGLALGVGPLKTAFSRALVRRALASARDLTVRDADSADRLEATGLPRPRVAADAALALPPPEDAPERLVTVSLRPWTGGGWGPVQSRRHDSLPGFADAVAHGLRDVHRQTGLGIHFVALQGDRDEPLHARVAARLAELGVHSTRAVPETPDEVLGEIARGRTAVAMRYHAGIAAILGGRPAVLIGYSPKVEALAAELGDAGRLLPLEPDTLRAELAPAVGRVLDQSAAADDARRELRRREAENERLLDRIFAP